MLCYILWLDSRKPSSLEITKHKHTETTLFGRMNGSARHTLPPVNISECGTHKGVADVQQHCDNTLLLTNSSNGRPLSVNSAQNSVTVNHTSPVSNSCTVPYVTQGTAVSKKTLALNNGQCSLRLNDHCYMAPEDQPSPSTWNCCENLDGKDGHRTSGKSSQIHGKVSRSRSADKKLSKTEKSSVASTTNWHLMTNSSDGNLTNRFHATTVWSVMDVVLSAGHADSLVSAESLVSTDSVVSEDDDAIEVQRDVPVCGGQSSDTCHASVRHDVSCTYLYWLLYDFKGTFLQN